MREHRLRWLVAALILTSGCVGAATPSGDSTGSTAGDSLGYPVIVRGVTIPRRPERIVSGSATHTEILFAVGAGPRVIATDDYSDYPTTAATLPHFDAFNPSVEGIAALEPDLVILAFDPGDVAAGLTTLDIPTLVFDAPASLDDAYRQFEEVGVAAGVGAEAARLAAATRDEITELRAAVPETLRPFTYYHELDSTYFTIGSDTFLGSIYGALGMVSIADTAGGGYPQLSAEFIVSADPDFVFLGDAACCGQSPATIAARPGWSDLGAVTAGRVIVVDESLSSRWGPRLVDLVRFLIDAVYGGGS